CRARRAGSRAATRRRSCPGGHRRRRDAVVATASAGRGADSHALHIVRTSSAHARRARNGQAPEFVRGLRRRPIPLRGVPMNPMPRLAQWLLFGLLQLACTTSAMALTLTHAGGGALSPPVTHGDYLYVGTGASLTVWNLADPAEPAFAGGSAAPAPGPIRALAMVGDYLYAAWNTP